MYECLTKRFIKDVNNKGIFESDKKSKLNKLDFEVDSSVLRRIEDGCSIETLEALNLPIFYYQTQITIHGKFPNLETSRIGSYQNIAQNKNLSIGIKYNAIDTKKKNIIEKALCYSNKNNMKFSSFKNSSRFVVFTSTIIDDEKHAIDVAKKYNNFISNLPKDIVLGNYSVYFVNIYGVVKCVLTIDINAIYQENLYKFIEIISGIKSEEELKSLCLQAKTDRKALLAKWKEELANQKK